MKIDETKNRFFVIRCSNGNYLCRSVFGAAPTVAKLKIDAVLDSVIRFSNRKEAKYFLRFPNMDSIYRHFLDGATIEQVTVTLSLKVETKEVKG